MAGKHEEASNEHINRFKMAHMIGVAEYMRERAKDYGLDGEDSIAHETAKANVKFVKEYQQEHNIGKPSKLYHKHKKRF